MVYEAKNTEAVETLFGDWEETLIWSCLQGRMGKLYVTDLECPVSAMALLGDFTFYAGEPDRELVSYRPEGCRQDFMIMVPQSEEWGRLIEQTYGEKAKASVRYAIKKEPGIFDREKLRRAAEGLSEEYTLCMIDERLYRMCKAEQWSADLVSQFADYAAYQEAGLGAVVLKDGEIVAGASSYSRYQQGIEIEIDTKESCRRRGLAYACGARLILECLNRNLYPSWDAQNRASVALAEKLGYHFSHEYRVYEINGY